MPYELLEPSGSVDADEEIARRILGVRAAFEESSREGARAGAGFQILDEPHGSGFEVLEEPVGTLGGLKSSLQRGAYQAGEALEARALDYYADLPGRVERERQAISALESQLPLLKRADPNAYQSGLREMGERMRKLGEWEKELTRTRPRIGPAAQSFVELGKKAEALPRSEAMQEWAAADNSNWWKVFARNPVEITANIFAESAPAAAVSVAGATAGGLAAGPAGAGVGAGAGSFNVEYAHALVDAATKAGVDMRDPEKVREFFSNEANLKAAREFATQRGFPIALFDALTAGVAGKFLKPALGKGFARVAGASGLEAGAQMTGGALGETAAQLAAGQPLSGKDIAAEAIGELLTTPGEAAANLRGELGRAAQARRERALERLEKTPDLKPGDVIPGTEKSAAVTPDALAELQAVMRGERPESGRLRQPAAVAPVESGKAGKRESEPQRPTGKPLTAAEAEGDERVRKFLADRGKDYSTMTRWELELLSELGDSGARSEYKARRARQYLEQQQQSAALPARPPAGPSPEASAASAAPAALEPSAREIEPGRRALMAEAERLSEQEAEAARPPRKYFEAQADYTIADAADAAGGVGAPNLDEALAAMARGRRASQVVAEWSKGRGEYDALADVLEQLRVAAEGGRNSRQFRQLAAAYRRAFDEGGRGRIDQTLSALETARQEGLAPAGGTPESGAELIERLFDHAQRRGEKPALAPEDMRLAFHDVLSSNAGRSATQNGGPGQAANDLRVGDRFQVRGTGYEVQSIDPDSGEARLVSTGEGPGHPEQFGERPRISPEIAPRIYPDKGTFRPVNIDIGAGKGETGGRELPRTATERAFDAFRRAINGVFPTRGDALRLVRRPGETGLPVQRDQRARERAWRAFERVFRRQIFVVETSDGSRLPFQGATLKGHPRALFLTSARANTESVLGHEFLESLRIENPDLYERLRTELVPLMREFPEYRATLNAQERAHGLEESNEMDAQRELIADFVGDLLANGRFLDRLAQRNPGLFKSLARALIEWLQSLREKLRPYGAGQWFSDVVSAEERVAAALEEHVRGEKAGERESEMHRLGGEFAETGGIEFSLEPEQFQFERPESVAEQRARLEREQAAREAKEREQAQAEELARRRDRRLVGDLGEAGQGGLFAEPGQQELFRETGETPLFSLSPDEEARLQEEGRKWARQLREARDAIRAARARGEQPSTEVLDRLWEAELGLIDVEEGLRGTRRRESGRAGERESEVDAGLQPKEPSAQGRRGVPPFRGPERLPGGRLRDLFDGLAAWRRRTGDWLSRREARMDVTVGRDTGDNRAGLSANGAAGHVRLTLNRAFDTAPKEVRKKHDLREYALTFVIEADGDRAALAQFHEQIAGSDQAGSKSGRRALAAIEFAEANWDRYTAAAAEYKSLTEMEREIELNEGVNSAEWRGGYVYHRWKREAAGGADPTRPSPAGTPFRRPRSVATYAEGLAEGRVPVTLNALELLSMRVDAGQKRLNELSWVHGLRRLNDPVTDEPVVVDVIRKPRRPVGTRGSEGVGERGGEPETFEGATAKPEWETIAPEGYRVMRFGDLEVAVQDGFAKLMTRLTTPSFFKGEAVKKVFGVAKSVLLLFDTFHLGRLFLWRQMFGLGGGYEKGQTLLDFTAGDIREMAARGEIPAEWADGLVENKRRAELALGTGFNVGSVLDNAWADALHSLPGIGRFNKWLFGEYQRGAMFEAWLIEFERLRRARPAESEQATARRVSRDLNARFGNLNRQGLFKSRTAQDLVRFAFLAPQWNESLIRAELGSAWQLLRAPVDTVKQRRLVVGTLLRATGTMALGTFLVNQVLNMIFRGKPTWENEEEGWDKKLSAWIPDVIGNGPGFFLNPLALPLEYTHLIDTQLHKSKDKEDAAWRILNSRLSNPSRALLTLATRRDVLGRAVRPGEVTEAMAKALAPVPIPVPTLTGAGRQLVTGEPGERYPGQFQKQALSSFGIKTDQAPTAEQRIRSLAREFNATKGIVPSGEFYTGDYDDLVRALRIGNMTDARDAMEELLTKKSGRQIYDHFKQWTTAPYTGQRRREGEFLRSLTAEQRAAYMASREARSALGRRAAALLREAVRTQPAR